MKPDLEGALRDALWDYSYWRYMALSKRRVWLHGWDWRVYLSGDEFERRTLSIGPVCIALWSTKETRESIRDCERAMDAIEDADKAAREAAKENR